MNKSNILSWQLNHNSSSQNNQDLILLKLEFLTIQILKATTWINEKNMFSR